MVKFSLRDNTQTIFEEDLFLDEKETKNPKKSKNSQTRKTVKF